MQVKIADIDIELSRNVSREAFNWAPADCKELAVSLATHGQLQPVCVRKLPSGKWKLVFGFRRFTAAVMLGWEEIWAFEAAGEAEDDAINNFMENIMRKDISLWEECVALRELFPEEMSHNDVGKALGKSRTWVRPRREIWKLDEETILKFQLDQLSASDLIELTKLSDEEQAAKAEMLAKAKEEGVTADSRTGTRRHPRSIKQLRRMQSKLYDKGREDWNAILLYCLGEIDDETLESRLEL